MPSIKRRLRQRREWTDSHLRQLRCGHDFFGDAWGDYSHLPMDQRGEWLTAEIREDMAACWERHGEAIKAGREAKFPGINEAVPCWGELVFERGMTGIEALRFHTTASYGQPRDAYAESFDVEGFKD